MDLSGSTSYFLVSFQILAKASFPVLTGVSTFRALKTKQGLNREEEVTVR